MEEARTQGSLEVIEMEEEVEEEDAQIELLDNMQVDSTTIVAKTFHTLLRAIYMNVEVVVCGDNYRSIASYLAKTRDSQFLVRIHNYLLWPRFSFPSPINGSSIIESQPHWQWILARREYVSQENGGSEQMSITPQEEFQQYLCYLRQYGFNIEY